MAKKDKIDVEEEEVKEETGAEKEESEWTEEFKVAGEELVEVVKNLIHEATVRHIEIINEKHDIHFKIPLAVGVVGIFFLGWYAAVALIAALVTECTIRVVRVEAEEKSADEAEAATV